MANTIQVFVPVGVASATKASSSAARHIGSDIVIGMLDNHKHGSTKILDRLEQRLTSQFGDIRFVRFKKSDAGLGATKNIIENLAKQCRVVINGVAD